MTEEEMLKALQEEGTEGYAVEELTEEDMVAEMAAQGVEGYEAPPPPKPAISAGPADTFMGMTSEDMISEAGDNYLYNAIGNIPSDAWETTKEIADAAWPPWKPAVNIGKMIGGGASKAARALGMTDEPLYQEGETMLNAMGEGLNESYGSLDAIANSFEKRPVNTLMDAAGLVAGGGALTAKALGSASKAGKIAADASKIAANLDPINLGVNAAKTGGSQLLWGGLAGMKPDLADNILKFSTKFRGTLKEKRAMRDTMIKENLNVSPESLNKISEINEAINVDRGNLLLREGQAGREFNLGRTYDQVGELKDKTFQPGSVLVDQKKRAMNKALDSVDEGLYNKIPEKLAKDFPHLIYQASDTVTPKQMHNRRVELDAQIKYADSALSKPKTNMGQETLQAMRRGVDTALKKDIPEIKPLDARQSSIKKLWKNLEKTVGNMENRNPMNIGTPMRILAGYTVGGYAGVGMAMAGSLLLDQKKMSNIALGLSGTNRPKIMNQMFPKQDLPMLLSRDIAKPVMAAEERAHTQLMREKYGDKAEEMMRQEEDDPFSNWL